MAEEIEYEALPEAASHGVHMLAGALAGISEHAVMFPVDSIKTRLQLLSPSPAAVYSGMSNAVARISSTEGLRTLWRGVASVIAGAGPAHAVQFGTLEAVKQMMEKREGTPTWVTTGVAGASAAITSDAVMTPFDVIKQRMQIHNSAFRSVITCARTIYRTEGLGAFYVSYPTTLLMTIPFTAVQFSVYDHTLDWINPTRSYDPMSHVTAGGIAGAVAAAVTTPLDVAKTLLQTRGTSHDAEIRRANGIRDAVKIIWRRDGLKGFARGLTPRVLTFVPSNALCWMSYEFFKMALRMRGSSQAPP
ncbi:putative MRS4-protein of the mitochondrial carrier family [Serendipita vermifera]|nr:putative MRS4-protein of the mitochondrial carrier family [Serendipita vermifera]